MTLVFGGAYQGKLAWALEDLGLGHGDVYTCRKDLPEIDLRSKVINGMHLYLLAVMREGRDPTAEVCSMLEMLDGKTVIIEDITAGVVPVDAEMRAWREAVGRTMGLLSARASRVVRVFCSIGVRIR